MRQRVANARHEHGPILEETSSFFTQRRDFETKARLLKAFNSHFIISENDMKILTTNPDTVDDDFFRVLAWVKRTHKDCQVLLGAENQRLGLELTESTSRQLNAAYQKLYRWILREFKNVNFENPQISTIIRRSLRELAERPTLFQNCLDYFAEARENVLLDAFYSALTGPVDKSSNSQTSKPIDFHAHDPLRYIGDMLAWTHSATVSEREALENLAASDGDEITRNIQVGTETQPWTVVDGEAFDGKKALEQLAGRNLEGVLRVLRQRVEQLIHSQEEPILTYRIFNLLDFYSVTFSRLLGPECNVVAALLWLKTSAFQKFQTIMEDHASSVQHDIHQLTPDLRVPDYLADALEQFRALMKSFDSSLTPALTREEDFQRIVSLALDPFLEISQQQISGVQEPQNEVFLINCLSAATTALSGYNFVRHRSSQLQNDISKSTTALVEYQHAYFLHNSGLHQLVDELTPSLDETAQELSTFLELSSLQPPALQQASQRLDDFLPSASMDAADNLKNLSDKHLGDKITAAAAERFCEDFEYVENRLGALDEIVRERGFFNNETDHQEDQVQLKGIFPRSSDEVRVLLS